MMNLNYFKKPYMTIGTLRDQIIYPDTLENMKSKKVTDKDLDKLLEKVQLQYLIERENGWDSIQDWLDVLSGFFSNLNIKYSIKIEF